MRAIDDREEVYRRWHRRYRELPWRRMDEAWAELKYELTKGLMPLVERLAKLLDRGS